MIGFGSRSLPRLTVSGIAGGAGCGVAIAGEGTAGSGSGMSDNWGGRRAWESWGNGRGSDPVCHETAGACCPECSGFFDRPKVAALFTGCRETQDSRFLENSPILSSLRNMPPILSTEDS